MTSFPIPTDNLAHAIHTIYVWNTAMNVLAGYPTSICELAGSLALDSAPIEHNPLPIRSSRSSIYASAQLQHYI
jgi:hypothetical protein